MSIGVVFVICFIAFLAFILGGLLLTSYEDYHEKTKNISAELKSDDAAYNFAQFNLRNFTELLESIHSINADNIDSIDEHNAREIMDGIGYLQRYIYPFLTEFSEKQHHYYMTGGYNTEITTDEIRVIANRIKDGRESEITMFDYDGVYKEKRKNGDTNQN